MATTVVASMFIALLVMASADGAVCDAASGASCEASYSASMLQARANVQHATQIGEGAVSARVFSEKELLDAAKRFAERKPLLIEQDLSQFHHSHYTAYKKEKSFGDNADEAFDNFLENSGLDEELDAEEKAVFKQHFKEFLEEILKHVDFSSTHNSTTWLEAVKEALQAEKPVLTKELVEHLNEGNYGFTVKITEALEGMSQNDFNNILGKTPAGDGNLVQGSASEGADFKVQGLSIPDEFDSGTQWSACSQVINRIHNQGRCGSCWAFGSVSALDSRLCIKANGGFSEEKAMLSRGQVTSCALGSGSNGCSGGLSRYTFAMFRASGGVTGGEHGCSPYFGHGEGTDHFDSRDPAPPCPTQCASSYTARGMTEDRFKLDDMQYQEIFRSNGNMMTLAKENMMQHGPLPFGIYANGAMMGYSSGIFQADCDANANHEVTAVGWGATGGVGYISALNSWGPNWGLGGAFKVIECGVTDFTLFDFSVAGSSMPNPLIAGSPASTTPAPSPASTTPAPSPASTTPAPSPASTTPAPSPASTTPTPSGDDPWSVINGPCTIDADKCLLSPNYPGRYENDQTCEIEVKEPYPELEVVDFSTERRFDWLTVNGNPVSGRGDSIHGVVARTIRWASDHSITRGGWKLCPKIEPAPTPAPTVCEDDPNYTDPHWGDSCSGWVGYRCTGFSFSAALMAACPKACRVCS